MLPRVPMSVVTKRTGLSPHVIRVWERRYGAVSPDRTEGGQRTYSEEDVSRLALLRSLSEAGHKISAIAALPTDALENLWRHEQPAAPRLDSDDRLVAEMLRAISKMDRATFEELLRRAALKF